MATGTNPVRSVWARPQREPDAPALSRAGIVREAIAMLDAEGVDALSMRKLGARLNAGATSLYRHVATKDELMGLVGQHVVGKHRVSAPTKSMVQFLEANTILEYPSTAKAT